jgi:hypothetical protein
MGYTDCPRVVARTMKYIFPSPPARAISFSLVRITTLGQSVYPDIALHISDYYINIALYIIFDRQNMQN